jgi:dipeptidyl aminopeptidase/acylaminoacyl peptidase
LAVPFDRRQLKVVGGPVAIEDGLRTGTVWGGAGFDVSDTGTLVHLSGGVLGANRRLQLISPDGTIEPWNDEPRAYVSDLQVSPDGRRFAVTIVNPRALYEIWGSEIDRPILRKLVAEPGADCNRAVWNHDGSLLAYTMSGESAQEGLFVLEVDGAAEPRLLAKRESRTVSGFPLSFSPDGTWLLGQVSSAGKDDLVLVRVDDGHGDGPAEPLLLIENARGGSISPDGRWIVYSSSLSGRPELYLREFRADGSVGREIPVTTTGAGGGGWFKQEQPLKLGYIADDGAYAVELRTEPAVDFSTPERFGWVTEFLPKVVGFDVLPDGRFLAILKGEEEEDPEEIRVVLNWFEELERKLAAGR